MILEDTADTSADPIPRDRHGWPIVPDPHNPGQTLKAHRPSSLAKKYLTDTYSVDRWAKRTIIRGAGLRPDLAAQAGPLHLTDDRTELDRLADEAAAAGGGETAANYGTARHTLLHKHLTGQEFEIPPDMADDYDAIRSCLDRHNVRLVGDWSERFVICHQIPAAGSADAWVTLDGYDSPIVLDLKTGGSPSLYSRPLENAVQLACYARAEHAWKGTGHPLEETPHDTNLTVAVVLWAPQGEAHAELVAVDIAQGWDLARLACEVRDQARRSVKRFILPPPSTAPAKDDSVLRTVGDRFEREPEPVTVPDDPADIIIDLRRRLAYLTDTGLTTLDAIAADWPAGCPGLKRPPQDHTDDTLALITNYVTLLEARYDALPASPAIIAPVLKRLKALDPAGLEAVTAQAKAAGVPNIEGGTVRRHHVYRLTEIINQTNT